MKHRRGNRGLILALALALISVLVWQRTSSWYRRFTSPAAVTKANGKLVIDSVRMYSETYGAPPSSLAVLVPNYLMKNPTDGWWMPFEYTVDAAGKVRLVSYGADAKQGGTGDDLDLWWEWSPGGQPAQGTGQPPP
jgi:hypothetical protein